METRCVENIALENSLLLKIHDHSRPMAGDRWLVVFVATVDIPILSSDKAEKEDPAVSESALRAVLGDTTQFRYEKRSYFVDEKEKNAVFNKLKKDFLDTTLGYLARPGFAEKLIRRKYAEANRNPNKAPGAH